MVANWEALLSEVRSCVRCEPEITANPVLQAHPDARVLIAGQAPGRRVHESGVVFADASGERLRDWLGVSEATFYDPRSFAILPMGFCYPGTGRSGDLPPRKECAPAWRQELLDGMPQIGLTVILGQHAVRWHLDAREPLGVIMSDWQQHWPGVVVLPHPSPRNNPWLARNQWFEADVLPRLRERVADLLAPDGNTSGSGGGTSR